VLAPEAEAELPLSSVPLLPPPPLLLFPPLPPSPPLPLEQPATPARPAAPTAPMSLRRDSDPDRRVFCVINRVEVESK